VTHASNDSESGAPSVDVSSLVIGILVPDWSLSFAALFFVVGRQVTQRHPVPA